jgi:hypothetical protein
MSGRQLSIPVGSSDCCERLRTSSSRAARSSRRMSSASSMVSSRTLESAARYGLSRRSRGPRYRVCGLPASTRHRMRPRANREVKCFLWATIRQQRSPVLILISRGSSPHYLPPPLHHKPGSIRNSNVRTRDVRTSVSGRTSRYPTGREHHETGIISIRGGGGPRTSFRTGQAIDAGRQTGGCAPLRPANRRTIGFVGRNRRVRFGICPVAISPNKHDTTAWRATHPSESSRYRVRHLLANARRCRGCIPHSTA